MNSLGDTCQNHDPGVYPATLPHKVTVVFHSLRAEYRCKVCTQPWVCWWDPQAAGWPVRCAY